MNQLNKIYTKLRNSFFPLDIEDPIELNLIQVANYVLMTAFAISASLFFYYLLNRDWFFVISTGIASSTCIYCKHLLNQRKVHLVYTILVIGIYCLSGSGTLYNQGINDIGVQTFYPILIISAICFQPKWFKTLGIVTICWFLVAYGLEVYGFYEGKPDINNPLVKLVFSIGMVCFAVATLQFTIQQFVLSNKQLQELKEKADSANVAKSQFLAKMSHELRTPLNAIVGYSEDIREEARLGEAPIDPLYLENVDYIIRSSETLLSLINKVLDLSKLEVEQMKVQISTFDLSELLAEISMTLQPIVGRNDNALTLKNLSTSQHVTSDQMKLRQILLNLLSNAAKFTSNGSILLEVQDAYLQDEPALSFVVSDNGIGIPEEQLELIFESFMQIDDSLARSHEGTGLGLAISKSFAHLLGGELIAESQIGHGSRFSLIIPCASPIFGIPQNSLVESAVIN